MEWFVKGEMNLHMRIATHDLQMRNFWHDARPLPVVAPLLRCRGHLSSPHDDLKIIIIIKSIVSYIFKYISSGERKRSSRQALCSSALLIKKWPLVLSSSPTRPADQSLSTFPPIFIPQQKWVCLYSPPHSSCHHSLSRA